MSFVIASERVKSDAPNPDGATASRCAGLLARLRRPSVAHRRGREKGGLKNCDRANGTPAACFVAWRGAPGRSSAGVARLDIVRDVEGSRQGIGGTMSNPARPEERQKPACSDAGWCSLSLYLIAAAVCCC